MSSLASLSRIAPDCPPPLAIAPPRCKRWTVLIRDRGEIIEISLMLATPRRMAEMLDVLGDAGCWSTVGSAGPLRLAMRITR